MRTENFERRRALRDKLQQIQRVYETVSCSYYNGTEMARTLIYDKVVKTAINVHASPNCLLRRLSEPPKERDHLGDQGRREFT